MILGTVFALAGIYTMVSTAVVPTSTLPECLKILVHLVVQVKL